MSAPARRPHDHASIGSAALLPSSQPAPFISITPIILSTPARPIDLHLKISLPANSTAPHPIILLSHGQGSSNNLSSMNGYGPLVSHFAAQGFAVIQPTHLSSKTLGLNIGLPGKEMYWQSRCEDMSTILSHLKEIEEAFPTLLKGRLDDQKVAVVGHSLGGQTASILLGATTLDASGKEVSLKDSRIKVGILLAAPGDGSNLTEWGSNVAPFMKGASFSEMKTPTLVVASSDDGFAHLTSAGPTWHAEPYTLSPGKKSLLTLNGGGHCLAGISGWDALETEKEHENVETVGVVQRMSVAWLKSVLDGNEIEWEKACKALESAGTLGRVESKDA